MHLTNAYEQISFKLLVRDTTSVYDLIPIWMILIFIQDHSIVRKLELVQASDHSVVRKLELVQASVVDCLEEAKKFTVCILCREEEC